MSLTIDELIIAASVDPRGIKVGLDQGVAEINRFSGKAANALTAAQSEVIEKANAMVRASALVDVQTAAGIKQFRTERAELQSLATQLGVVEHVTNQLATAEAVVGRNRTLAASYLRQLNTETVKQAQAVRDLVVVETAAAPAIQAVTVAVTQQADAVQAASNRIVIGGRDITQRLSTIGVGAAFAFEQMVEGGARGEGAMRRVLRAVGILALSIGGPEGAIVAAASLGIAALMDFFNRSEREAKKAADKIREHIATASNSGNFDDLREQGRQVQFGTPFSGEGDNRHINKPSTLVAGAYAGSLADLNAQLQDQLDKLYQTSDRAQERAIAERIRKLREQIRPLKALMQEIQEAAGVLRSRESDAAGQLPGMSVEALSPNAKTKAERDRGPYADLRDQIGELTTAYESMRKSGIGPTLDLQTKLETAFERTTHMLRDLKDQSGPAANALRAILADMENSGIHDRDALLPGGTALKIGGSDAKTVDAFIERVRNIREATGEFSQETQTVEAQLSHMLDGVNLRIEQQGGAMRASNDILKQRADILKEMNHETTAEGKGLWTPEMADNLRESMKNLKGALKDNNDEWAAMRIGIEGVLDAAGGLGAIPQSLRQTTDGLLHAISAAKQIKDVTKGAKDGQPAGDGLNSLAGMSSLLGLAGAAISIGAGLKSMFSGNKDAELQEFNEAQKEHTAAIQQNTLKLAELTASLIPEGLAGASSMIDTITNIIASQKGSNLSLRGGVFDDIINAANKAGFNITNKDGQIVMDQLQVFLDYLKKSNTALLTFSQSLSDQTSLSSLRQLVYGKNSAADAITSTIDILSQFAPKLGKQFEGLDATTAEGREKIRTALQALFDALAAGTLTLEDFGKLGGAKDLAGLITTLAQSLNSMDSAVNAVTGSLTNVPTWYKVNLARYLAADVQNGPDAVTSTSPSRFGNVPGATDTGGQGYSGGAGSPLAAMLAGSKTPTINIQRIEVDARQLTADEIFAAVLAAAQRAASVQFGDSTRWSDVQAVT